MFNKEQARAIAASSKNDVLIAAGAGSGKTKTLSERVFRLVQDGELRPDELLVLTFTNNAAHAAFWPRSPPISDDAFLPRAKL